VAGPGGDVCRRCVATGAHEDGPMGSRHGEQAGRERQLGRPRCLGNAFTAVGERTRDVARPFKAAQSQYGRASEYIRADRWTWARWNEVSELQVAEALALHHHLDPERLGIRRATDPVFQLVCKHLGGQGQPLWEFFCQLA